MSEHLPVRTRRILAADGSQHVSLYVTCPRRFGATDLEACKACAHAQDVSGRQVECSPEIPEGTHAESWAASIAPHWVNCVRDSVIAASLAAWVPPEPWAIPVVDADSRFIGFVSSSHTLAAGTTARLAMALPVRELAIGSTLVVHEAEPWPQALRQMARRRAHVIAVVDDAWTPRGVLRDVDVLRLLAARPTEQDAEWHGRCFDRRWRSTQ
jgi:CBS domain protein